MSNKFFLSWHMIVREDIDNFKLSIESLQGLYDELIIAVDSRPESDEVFNLINHYPNVSAYRQVWTGRFDNARQDALNRISKNATYVGCCDSDEVLVTPSPIELRKYLIYESPKAVNLSIHYTEDVGPNSKNRSYLRTKIWNTSYPRKWVGWIHEYPACETYYDPTPKPDIVFKHLKVDHKLYRSQLIIEVMNKEINEGTLRWKPYLAQEYRSLKQYEKAIKECIDYIKLQNSEYEHLKVAAEELLYNYELLKLDKYDQLLITFSKLINNHNYLINNPIINEYLAISYYYKGDKNLAKEFHKKAVNFIDNERELNFIRQNDKWFL